MGMGFPVNSHENGNKNLASMRMGKGMGIISAEVGKSEKYRPAVQKFPFANRFIILFVHLNF